MTRACSSVLLLVVVLSPVAPAAAAGQTLSLRDAVTGIGLSGEVTLATIDTNLPLSVQSIESLLVERSDSSRLEIAGRSAVNLEGTTLIRAQAAGYRTLHAVLRPDPGNAGWTLLLDPVEQPAQRLPTRPDLLLIDGWVLHAGTLEPLAGARVTVAHSGISAISDAHGYFSLELSAPPVRRGRPEPLELRASHARFDDWYKRGLLAGAGRTTLQIAMGAAVPDGPTHRQLMREARWPPADPAGRRSPDAEGLRADEPPSSITVGFGDAGCSIPCCTGACPHSCVMSIEQYVRRGVGDEWIASWQHDALSAGVVAYRSYGAWHVFNPPSHGAYDICSSACCQVNDPDLHSSTDEAAAATAGLMLVRNGAAFRSEYSAQNNCLQGELSCSNADLSCGDGHAGSPATGWPCLADPVGQGYDCFGHGRGMSQWGNHFWTQSDPPRNWKWQLNHYYNDHGSGSGLRTATISQVLSIGEVGIEPGEVPPGQALNIEMAADNLAAAGHSQVLIGASLRRGSDPFIDDPANDQAVSLPSGGSTVARLFELPPDTPPGDYALWLALWIDVDRDGQISSDDLSQHLVIVPNAVTVAGHGLFRDRFETDRSP